jgi:hypothetical protein
MWPSAQRARERARSELSKTHIKAYRIPIRLEARSCCLACQAVLQCRADGSRYDVLVPSGRNESWPIKLFGDCISHTHCHRTSESRRMNPTPKRESLPAGSSVLQTYAHVASMISMVAVIAVIGYRNIWRSRLCLFGKFREQVGSGYY